MDLSRCFLHTLGDAEASKLADLRSRLPAIFDKVCKSSESYQHLKPHDFVIWKSQIAEKSDGSDIVLLKFLRAEELNVDKAAERLAATLIFRLECAIDELAKSELPEHFRGHDFVTGLDDDGRPVMISRFGGMDIDKVFGDVEAFVRYRVHIMEQTIGLLKLEKGRAEDLCQVHDYSGVLSSMYKADVKNGVSAISKVFSEHYPEFKGKTIFLNFPAVFSKPFQVLASLLPERTRKKFVILGQDDHEALFQHVTADLVPEILGGLLQGSGRSGPSLTSRGRVAIPRARETVSIAALEVSGACTILWELRVCTLEVAYQVFFTSLQGGEEEIIAESAPGSFLKAEDGVQSGQWSAKGAGTLSVRFNNSHAWFKRRVCVCRAEAKN